MDKGVSIANPFFQDSIHVLKYDSTSHWSPRKFTTGLGRTIMGVGGSSGSRDTEMATMNETFTNFSRRTKFKGIDPSVEYTFRVCTLINGKTISRKLHTMKVEQTSELQLLQDAS